MGRTPRSDRHRTQALPKPKIEPKNEIEQLREENQQLRELVAHLAKPWIELLTRPNLKMSRHTFRNERARAAEMAIII